MDIVVNKQKFIKILESNKVAKAWKVNDPSFQEHCIIGLFVYLQFLETISPKDFSNKSFSKIPHIKLLRTCSNIKNYDMGEDNVMGLKMAKEVFEDLAEQGFLIYDQGEKSEHSWQNNDSYFITDIGIMLRKEVEECISIPRDKEIAWIKTLLLHPSILDINNSYWNISSKFIEIYLDFIYYGGTHVRLD